MSRSCTPWSARGFSSASMAQLSACAGAKKEEAAVCRSARRRSECPQVHTLLPQVQSAAPSSCFHLADFSHCWCHCERLLSSMFMLKNRVVTLIQIFPLWSEPIKDYTAQSLVNIIATFAPEVKCCLLLTAFKMTVMFNLQFYNRFYRQFDV